MSGEMMIDPVADPETQQLTEPLPVPQPQTLPESESLESELRHGAVLTFYDTETNDALAVEAPEAQVAKLMYMEEQERYAAVFFADGAVHLYFPDDDNWVVNPLQIVHPDNEQQLLTADHEDARWLLPLRFSPSFTGDHLVYLSLDHRLFRLDWQTGQATLIWQSEGSVYGMAVSPDGKRAALLLDQNGNLGADVEIVLVDLDDDSPDVQRQYAAHVPKSDGFLAHMDITWIDAGTLGYESWVRVKEDDGTGWRRGLFVWETNKGTLAYVPVPDETRRFYFASDLSRYVIEWQETREVRLLDNDGQGVPVLTAEPDESRIPTVAGKQLADINVDAGSGRMLGNGMLLGWMRDRWVIWYQNASNETIEDLFF